MCMMNKIFIFIGIVTICAGIADAVGPTPNPRYLYHQPGKNHEPHHHGGCYLDDFDRVVKHRLKYDEEFRRRHLNGMTISPDFHTDTQSIFQSYSCIGAGPWGASSECFLQEVTDAYMSELENISVVKLRMRPSTFADSNGTQLIEDDAINELIAQAKDRYENDSKIEIVNMGVQVIMNDTLYNSYMFLDDTTDDHDNRCAALDWHEVYQCVSDCTPGYPNASTWYYSDLCPMLDVHVTGLVSKDANCTYSGTSRTCNATAGTCLANCSYEIKQCFYQVIVDYCLPKTKDIVHAQTAEALNLVQDLTSTNQIEAVFMKMNPNYCGIGLNYNSMKTWSSHENLPWPGPSMFFQNVMWNNVCNDLISNTFEHELGHVLSLYHTHQGNEFKDCSSSSCRSRNDEWNGGDFVASTGVFPSPFDPVTVSGLTCSGTDSCKARDVMTTTHSCGNIAIKSDVDVGTCMQNAGIDSRMETNLMSYSYLGDWACPQFDTELSQRARMRCWVDRHEYRSTQKETGPSLVTVVTGNMNATSIALSWVPPLNTLTEAWNISVDGLVGYEIHRTPAFPTGTHITITSGIENRRYVDTNVIAGTNYTYRVRPFASGGSRTFSSQSPLSPALQCELGGSSSSCEMIYTFQVVNHNETPNPDGNDKGSSDSNTLAAVVSIVVLVLAVLNCICYCCCRTKK